MTSPDLSAFIRGAADCSNYGHPCDSDGEWHTHWHGAQPGPDTAHTFVSSLPSSVAEHVVTALGGAT